VVVVDAGHRRCLLSRGGGAGDVWRSWSHVLVFSSLDQKLMRSIYIYIYIYIGKSAYLKRVDYLNNLSIQIRIRIRIIMIKRCLCSTFHTGVGSPGCFTVEYIYI